MRVALSGLLLCVGLLVTGCGSAAPVVQQEPPAATTPAPEQSAPDSHPPTDSGQTSAEAVRAAKQHLVRADTGVYVGELTTGSQVMPIRATGYWRISRSEGVLSFDTMTPDGEPVDLDYRIFKDATYFTTSASGGCWTKVSSSAAAELMGTASAGPAVPGHAQALLSARGDTSPVIDGAATGSIRLVDATVAAGPGVSGHVRRQLPPQQWQRARVNVTFRITTNGFAAWTMTGDQLLDALADAGAGITPEAFGTAPEQISQMVWSVTFSDLGSPITMSRPDDDEVVAWGEDAPEHC